MPEGKRTVDAELPSPLAVILRPWPAAGERIGMVTLKNISNKCINISYINHPLYNLDLVVATAEGQIVSNGFYGRVFCDLDEVAEVLVLQPGEEYVHTVALFQTAYSSQAIAGVYSFQAVYHLPDREVKSEPLTINYSGNWPPVKPDWWPKKGRTSPDESNG